MDRMSPSLSRGQELALRRSTIEQQAKALTKPQDELGLSGEQHKWHPGRRAPRVRSPHPSVDPANRISLALCPFDGLEPDVTADFPVKL